MKLSRRDCIGLAGGTLLAGCAPIAGRVRQKASVTDFALPEGPITPGKRLFDRAGFGPRPGDLTDYAAFGHETTVDRLLRADEAEDPSLTMQLMRLDVLRVDSSELEDLHEETVLRQLQQAAILRAVYGKNPLLERMADFWTNHFNVYGKKRPAAWQKGADEASVIRQNALGSFPEMLKASAKSPAMLAYLDGNQNQKGQPNENYARELMELHTLGVDGGYTQEDVMEVARCFSGWTIEDRFLRPRGKFRFDPERHDGGEKKVLGHRIPAGGGVEDGERVLEILASHPSTAKYLARKMALYFVGEQSSAIEETMERAYLASSGDIRTMLRPLLVSQELLDGPAILKRPFDLMVSALRALDVTTDGGPSLQDHLVAMGQPLYQWPMPDGYPVDSRSWSGSMLPRWNFAFALGSDEIGGTSLRKDIGNDRLFEVLLGRKPNDGELGSDAVALCVASPEFQWR